MRTDPSSMAVAGVFLALAVLSVIVIIIKLTERKGDVLHGGYIEGDGSKD